MTTCFADVVKCYGEPTLTLSYGEQYLNYRRNVSGWWTRPTPWRARRQRPD